MGISKSVATAILGAGLLAGGALFATTQTTAQQESTAQPVVPSPSLSEAFETLLITSDRDRIDQAIAAIDAEWHPSLMPKLLETTAYAASRYSAALIYAMLAEKTGENFAGDLHGWYEWLWNQPEMIEPDYADYKADLYRQIDPVFEGYFKGRQASARIRLDEIRWGGVVQDGIPPLRGPEMISAKKARYLDDDNIVFGIEINGDARAYPKRILAWHEMFVDTVGGVDIAGVYCTLCGTVIPYKTTFQGKKHELGTSGFLYRSNKLMYDRETQSLWNTITGEPVVGPLVDQGIALEHLSVVTTTWGEWKRRHPKTSVLSLKTGHRRDYGEGVAYQEYFATDRLMFNTPFNDERLKNKQEVLALRFAAAPGEQLAIDTDFLNENTVYAGNIGLQKFVVLTDKTGANRVFDPENVNFVSYDGDAKVTDETGVIWELTEQSLTAPDGRRLERLPYHRAFWFGWRAAYPETKLIK